MNEKADSSKREHVCPVCSESAGPGTNSITLWHRTAASSRAEPVSLHYACWQVRGFPKEWSET